MTHFMPAVGVCAEASPELNHPERYGGQIVFSTTTDPKSFNAVMAKETSTTLVTGHIFEGLTKTNAYTARIEPNLADRWDISSDGLIWTFHLRRDVRWNDGHPFTADDVVFTFNELVFNETIPSSARDIFTIEGQQFLVEKVDDYTVRFTLPVKFAPFLLGLGEDILPKHKLEQLVKDGEFNFSWGIDTPPEEIVGTGAYKLVKYNPGQRLIFEKNPYYWRKTEDGDPLPYIQKIIYIIDQNPDVGLLKFIEGSVDSYGLRGMDYPLIKPLEEEKNFTVYNLGPERGSQFIFFNQNTNSNPETGLPYVDPVKSAWFCNVAFRRAIAHVIDKKQIIEIVKNGLGYPQYSPIGPGGGFFHNPDVTQYAYDPEKAREILAKAGFKDRDSDGIIEDKDGHPVEFNLVSPSSSTDRNDIAAIIRQDLENIGMNVNYKLVEFNTIVSQINSSFDWDAIVLGLTGGIEPHFGMNVWNSGGQLHMWFPRQEKPATSWEQRIDELFNAGVQELNEDKRKTYYDEFQQIVSDQLPVIYTVLSARIVAVRDRFENLDPTNYGGVFHNLEELYLREEER